MAGAGTRVSRLGYEDITHGWGYWGANSGFINNILALMDIWAWLELGVKGGVLYVPYLHLIKPPP